MATLRVAIDSRSAKQGGDEATQATRDISRGAGEATKEISRLDAALNASGATARNAARGFYEYFDGAQIVRVANTEMAASADKVAPAAARMRENVQATAKAATGAGNDILLSTVTWTSAFIASTFVMRRVVNEMDAIGKVAEKIGAPVEFVSDLAYQADLANTNLAEVLVGFRAFASEIQKAQGGNKQSAALFQSIGVNPAASGDQNATVAAYLKTADAVARMEDGFQKLETARQLFGRGAAAMIPLLNEGADGFNAGAEEARRFNVELSQQKAQDAANFADSVDRLNKLFQGVVISLSPVVTNLAQVASVILQNNTLVGLLRFGLEGVVAGFAALKAIQVVALVGNLANALRLAAIGQWGLNAAMAANPIGLLATAIGLITAAITYFSSSNDDASKKQKEQAKATEDQTEAANRLAQALAIGDEMRDRIAALQLEISLVGKSASERERATVAMELDRRVMKDTTNTVREFAEQIKSLTAAASEAKALEDLRVRVQAINDELYAKSVGSNEAERIRALREFAKAASEAYGDDARAKIEQYKAAQDAIRQSDRIEAVRKLIDAAEAEQDAIGRTADETRRLARDREALKIVLNALTASERDLGFELQERYERIDRTTALKSAQDELTVMRDQLSSLTRISEEEQRRLDLYAFIDRAAKAGIDNIDHLTKSYIALRDRIAAAHETAAGNKARESIKVLMDEVSAVGLVSEEQEKRARLANFVASLDVKNTIERIALTGAYSVLLDQLIRRKQQLAAIEARRSENEALGKEIQSIELEISLIGKSVEEQQNLRIEGEARTKYLNANAAALAAYIEKSQTLARLQAEQRARESTSRIIEDMRFELDTIALSNEERQKEVGLRQLQVAAVGLEASAVASLMQEYARLADEIAAANKRKELADSIAQGIGNGVEDALMHLDKLRDAAKAVFEDIQRAALRAFVTNPIVNSVSSGLQNAFGSVNLFNSANGNVFSGPEVVPFAYGGIINRETHFPMSNGRTGRAGENGPEWAIAPLERGPNGKLGVNVSGAGGHTISVTVHVHGNADADTMRYSGRQIAQNLQRVLDRN